jgi:hypothetical protein
MKKKEKKIQNQRPNQQRQTDSRDRRLTAIPTAETSTTEDKRQLKEGCTEAAKTQRRMQWGQRQA